ncbi:nucleoporin complex subunit 54-domain-containing protein [Amylostereum chailletii]|nr:nucleoporin complex subunit 54-domain-containing protein [Amylostereum chailletii]
MSGTTGGLFGNANTSTNPGGGLFGSATQPSTASTANQPSLFGQTQTQPQGSLFGSTAQTQPQSGLLGGSLFGGPKAAAVPAHHQADAQAQFAQLSQRIEAIASAWNPNSPNNRFQHYFYNLVDPAQVGLYGRPQNATDETLWQRALRENPDPSCMVPVLATSFDDLQKRVDAQGQQASAHQEKLTEIRSRIEKLGDTHNLKNVARLRQATVVQAQLTHRLLSMVQHLHLLIPALRSSSIRPEEEALRVALEEIESEVRRPGGMGRLVGKLNELWALVGALNALKSANAGGRTEWTVVDEDGLNQIVQILSEQQAGLAHVTKIVQKGLRDTAVIYGEEPRAEEGNGRTDLLQSFSQTMRASTLR